MPIEINGNQVSVLDDAEAGQHAERTALAASQLTGLATWGWLARLLWLREHTLDMPHAERTAQGPNGRLRCGAMRPGRSR